MELLEGIFVLIAMLCIIGFGVWWKRSQTPQSKDVANNLDALSDHPADPEATDAVDLPIDSPESKLDLPRAMPVENDKQHELPQEQIEEVAAHVIEDGQEESVPHTDTAEPTGERAEAIEAYVAEQEAQLAQDDESTTALEETMDEDPQATPQAESNRPNFELPPTEEKLDQTNDAAATGDTASAIPQDAAKDERMKKLLSRPIPPRRSRPAPSTQSPPAQPIRPANVPQGSTIPPRRSSTNAVASTIRVANLQPAPTDPPLPVARLHTEDTSATPTQLPDNSANDLSALQQHSSGLQEEISQLRLQLDASQQELMHLTAARDQALSIVSQNENQLNQLQTRATNAANEREQFQRDRDTLSSQLESLKAEQDKLKSQLTAAQQTAETAQDSSTEAIRDLESKHTQTIEELREALGQREAAEASIARERDAVAEQVAELQRKLDSVDDATKAEPNAEQTYRITELEKNEYQIKSELSLANETVRQLNQNLSQRDARLMQLQQTQESARTEVAALQQKLDEAPSAEDVVPATQMAEATERLAAAQKELEATREQLAAVQQKAGNIQSESESLQQERDKLHGELTSKQKAEDAVEAKLQGALSDVEARNETIAALHSELDELKKKHNHTSITPSER